MRPGLLLGAAALLSVERACYVWIAWAPGILRRAGSHPAAARFGGSVALVVALFGAFKIVQFTVFLAWCYVHGNGTLVPAAPDALVLGTAAALIVGGQILNLSVFYRLGVVGVFFGDRLGHEVPWCRAFPFSWISHPQYVGALLSIWGFFLVMRFPHADWFTLPAVETVYYSVGAYFEARGTSLAGPGRPTESVWCGRSLPPPGRRRSGSDVGLERPAIGGDGEGRVRSLER